MSGRPANPFADDIYMADQDAPMQPKTAYTYEREETLRPRRWDVRSWKKRVWAIIAAIVAVIIIVVVVAVVEVEKENRYPAYAPLKYSLSDTCMHPFPPSFAAVVNTNTV